LIVGMKNYSGSKDRDMKNLDESHKDAKKIEQFLLNELFWKKERIIMMTDSNVELIDLDKKIQREIDEMQIRS